MYYTYSSAEGKVLDSPFVLFDRAEYETTRSSKSPNDRERVMVQLVAFKDNRAFTMKPAVSVEVRIDMVKFSINCIHSSRRFS